MNNITKMEFVESMQLLKKMFDKNFKLGQLPYQLIRDWNLNEITYNQTRIDMQHFEAFLANAVFLYDDFVKEDN